MAAIRHSPAPWRGSAVSNRSSQADGASGLRERAARTGGASGRRGWAARAGGARGWRGSDGVQTGRYWENSGPRSPRGGWVTGGRPRGRTSVPGEVIWWLGWPFGDSDGHSPAMPPMGRVKNARKTTAGALGQAGRSGRTNPQLRAARGAAPKRARTPIAARASREPRYGRRITWQFLWCL